MDDQWFIREYRRMKLLGFTNARMMTEFMMARSVFYRHVQRLGLSADYTSHEAAIPWTIPQEEYERQPVEIRYLRELSLAAQKKDPYQGRMLNAAIRWARKLIAADLDILWDGEAWVTPPADPEAWHIKIVHDEAIESLTGQRPD